MNTGNSTRSRSVISGALALVVTTLLTSSLVGSFDPAQLEQIEGATQDHQAIVEARRVTTLDNWM
jgi:hypothetical protein